MENEYKSFYLKELIPMIDRAALFCQKQPNMMAAHHEDTTLVLVQNTMVAAYNRGIMKLWDTLRKELSEGDNDNDGDT